MKRNKPSHSRSHKEVAEAGSLEVSREPTVSAEPTKSSGGISNRSAHLCAIGLLVLLGAQLFLSARNKSGTMDEPNHIARGLAYLHTNDLRLSKEHPPLINVICALPLLFDRSIVLPLDDPSWNKGEWYGFAETLLWKVNANGPSMIARARLPVMGLTVLLGIITYLWASELYGAGGALLALFVLAADPNVIANGQLATNDLGVTCFYLAYFNELDGGPAAGYMKLADSKLPGRSLNILRVSRRTAEIGLVKM